MVRNGCSSGGGSSTKASLWHEYIYRNVGWPADGLLLVGTQRAKVAVWGQAAGFCDADLRGRSCERASVRAESVASACWAVWCGRVWAAVRKRAVEWSVRARERLSREEEFMRRGAVLRGLYKSALAEKAPTRRVHAPPGQRPTRPTRATQPDCAFYESQPLPALRVGPRPHPRANTCGLPPAQATIAIARVCRVLLLRHAEPPRRPPARDPATKKIFNLAFFDADKLTTSRIPPSPVACCLLLS